MIASVTWKIRKFFTANGSASATSSAATSTNRRQALNDRPPTALDDAGTRTEAWLASMTLHPAHDGSAEQPARLHQQHGDDQEERDGELQLAAEIGDEGPGDVLDHPDREAAHHGTPRAGEAADHRGGEAVQQNPQHHVGLKEHDRRDQHAGDRADRRRHAPAERDHPADANAGEPRGFRVGGGGAHGEADAGVAEEQIEERQKPERHRDHAAVMRADQAAAEQGTRTKRGGKALDGVVPDPAGEAVDDGKQRDEHHDVAEHRRVVDRLEHDALDGDAADERYRDGDDERDPVGGAPVHQLPGDEGREHRHLALGEIEVIDRLVDHHHGKRDAGVDTAGRESGQHLVQQQFPVHLLFLIAEIGTADRLVVADRMRRTLYHQPPGLDQISVVGEIERQRGVLLDQQHAHVFIAVEVAQDAEQLLYDQRGEPERRLVEQHQARAQHHGAADRQHLLLAAGQGAGLLAAPLLEPREIAVDALDVGGDG